MTVGYYNIFFDILEACMQLFVVKSPWERCVYLLLQYDNEQVIK